MNFFITKAKQIILCAIIFITQINLINAATITWDSSVGDWDDPTHWDLGVVPQAKDEVIIPGGTVYIPAYYVGEAGNIDISLGARLQVRFKGTLYVNDAVDKNAIANRGSLYVYGQLFINNVTQKVTSLLTGNGILNTQILYVGSRGEIVITDVDQSGIYGTSVFSKITNKGKIDITAPKINGIYTLGKNFNYGDITISLSTDINTYGILSLKTFFNYSNGTINVNGGSFGISNSLASSNFDNWGTVSSINAGKAGIINHGIFTNYNSGTTTSDLSGTNNFFNEATGELHNKGDLYCLNSGNVGMKNKNWIKNDGYINLVDATKTGIHSHGLYNYIDNHGHIEFSGTMVQDFSLSSGISNHADGKITQRNRFILKSNALFLNSGFLIGDTDASHQVHAAAIFINYGVVEDKFENFTPVINNQQVIVSPVSGILQNGVAFGPVLDVVSDVVINYHTWETDFTNGQIAGTYDEVTNEFTPQPNAIGSEYLYVELEIVPGFQTHNCEIKLDNPVSSIISKDPNGAMLFREASSSKNENSENLTFTTFPNPTNRTVQLKSSFSTDKKISVRLVNSIGQQIMEKEFIGTDNLRFDFPNSTANGLYFIHIYQGTQFLETQKVQYTSL